MNKREQIQLLQLETLKQYENLFWIIIFGFGGIITKVHLEKVTKQKNIKIFLNISLLRQIKIGRNAVYIATKPVFNYFGLINKTVSYKSSKMLKSALLGEIYLKYEDIDIERLKKQINYGNMRYYSVNVHRNLMNRIYNFLKETKHYADLWGLKMQLELLEKRQFAISNRRKGKNGSENVNKRFEDLYTLSCKDIYIQDLSYDYEDKKIYFNICILDTNNMTNRKIADYIELSIKALEEIMHPVNVMVKVFFYTHRDIKNAMQSDIIKKLIEKKEFIGRSDYIKGNVFLKGFNSANRLFGGVNVKTIL